VAKKKNLIILQGMRAKFCRVCNNTFRGSRRKHFVSKHQKCKTCKKWGDYINEHCFIKCSICKEKTCNIKMHLQLVHYFKCPDCLRFFKRETDHPLVECVQCKMKVCNINNHLAIFINCRNDQLLGSNPPLGRPVRFVSVKCEACKLNKNEECRCYTYALK
jgi:hypothetical protein